MGPVPGLSCVLMLSSAPAGTDAHGKVWEGERARGERYWKGREGRQLEGKRVEEENWGGGEKGIQLDWENVEWKEDRKGEWVGGVDGKERERERREKSGSDLLYILETFSSLFLFSWVSLSLSRWLSMAQVC